MISLTPVPSWVPEPPYRSLNCVIGIHDRCREAEPRESDVPDVRYLVCTCPCHRHSLTQSKGTA